MIDSMLEFILVEDNSADGEMVLDALRETHLANRAKVLKDGEEAVNYIFRQGEYGGGFASILVMPAS